MSLIFYISITRMVFSNDAHLAITRGDVKYIQYHGVWDLEELYDLGIDPEETVNRINDPAYYVIRQELREALYAGAANPNGENAIPYTPRLAEE